MAENSTAIPKVVAYRVNDVSVSGAGREIFEGVGNKKSDDMLVYTSQLRDYSSVEELFNGTTNSGPNEVEYEPIQRTLFRKEKPYTTPMMMKKYGQTWGAEKNRANKMGVDISMSEEKIATNYGSKPSDLGLSFGGPKMQQEFTYTHTNILPIYQIPDPSDPSGVRLHPSAITTDTINPSTPILILERDTETKTKGGNASLYKVEPLENKAGDTLFIFDNQPGVYWDNRDVIDNETYGNEVTSANSIFEYVRGADEFIGENKKAEGESELFGVGAVRFSNKLQRTGGQSCQMYTFWKQQDDDPVSYSRKADGGPSDRQECLIAKKNIPLPTKFPARPNWDNQDENHFSSSIEIDIYIESLEKAYVHKTTSKLTHLNSSNVSDVSYGALDMITARRGIAICFSEDAPTSGQSFYDFVKDHAVDKNSTRAHSYYSFYTSGGYTGQEGSTNGAMWSISPNSKAIIADAQGGTSSTAKNFSGVLIVMTPEGPAIIPSSTTNDERDNQDIHRSGWLIDDNTKDIQVTEGGLFTGTTGLDDILGKWIRLVFKVTPDGWTCYGPDGQSSNVLVSHHERGIYGGQQHTSTNDSGERYGPAQTSHSILQIVDLGSDELIKDRTLHGDDITDYYPIDNHYAAHHVPGNSGGSYGHLVGSEFGGNSLQHWPKNLSIWTMNYKNDKNVNLGKDEYMAGPTSDTSSSVFIDAVRFNNFNFQIKNCSAKKYNPNASPLNIGPSSVWAGPDYPKINNPLLEGLAGNHKTNAPVVLSFGFKNASDVNKTGSDSFKNFTSDDNGNWLLFNGYQTANLGANEEIPDCNIRFGFSGGMNGEIEGGATTGTGNGGSNQVLKQLSASGDGTTINDFFIMKLDEDDMTNKDYYHAGTYITLRAGTGKDQTRKIYQSEYKDSNEQYVAVQPQFYNTGGTDTYVAITSHAFGNQFRNECIGAHRLPGQYQWSQVGSSPHEWQKTMYTSRAFAVQLGDGTPSNYVLGDQDANNNYSNDTAVWDYPRWKYNDVGWSTVGSPSLISVGDSPLDGELAYFGYGTAQAGAANTITLQSDQNDEADGYNGMMIIIEGGTGAGQIREIIDYDTSRVATVNKDWDTIPDDTSKYRIRAAPFVGGQSSGPETTQKHVNVSAGTHNNWIRKYSNSVTVYSTSGNPMSEYTDLQGGADNTARFESKWFDTGYSEKGGGAVNINTNFQLDPHLYKSTTASPSSSSNDYSPIRKYDNLSIGSVGQVGQQELAVSDLPSAFDLIGSDANITIKSATALPAAIDATIDRPVYNKLPSSINNFNRKGFARFSCSNEESSCRVYKRENLAASVRITEIDNPENGQITFTVDNANTLSSDDDEEYIIYMYGQMASFNDATEVATNSAKGGCFEGSPYAATGLRIVSRDISNNTVKFLWDGKANNGDYICTYENLPALMISPYRYWFYLVIDCTDETGQKALNPRSYRSVSWMESNVNNMAGYLATGEALGDTYNHANVAGTLAARQNLGSTWNEFKFNDANVGGIEGAYVNEWDLTRMEKGSSLDCTTDYGYGQFNAEDNTGGYCGKHIFYKNESESQTENIMNMPYIVSKAGLQPKQDMTLLLAFEDESLPHTLTLKARNPADSTYDPAIYSVYWDDRPAHPQLSVKPDEEDAFIPKFVWEASDDDLWYGSYFDDAKIGWIDNRNIPSQYHNMIGHIPLNEDKATTSGGIYFENGAGIKTAASGGTFTNTREGLAGWSKDFNGTDNYLKFANNVNFATKPSDEMTIVIHAIPDAAQGAQANLLAKHTGSLGVVDYEIYIDTYEKVNAKIKTSSSVTILHLKSNTILPRDGQNPVSIILTFDNNLKGGNMKLFIDGKLEDQSGLMDSTGTANRLKRGDTIAQGSGDLYLGASSTDGGTGRTYFYDGKIEEVVIYNKCLYPVNPKDGQFKLTKPLREVENGSPVSYQGRLFIKDYHNIRGNRTLDVASSSPVSFAKAGFRLS